MSRNAAAAPAVALLPRAIARSRERPDFGRQIVCRRRAGRGIAPLETLQRRTGLLRHRIHARAAEMPAPRRSQPTT
jgi:hypothetical protein